MDFKKINLEKELQNLKYYEDSINLSNIIPIEIAHFFGENERELNIIGGRDLDYEGIFGKYNISGSAMYGTCEITLVNAPRRPKEFLEKEKNKEEYEKFYNPRPMLKGRISEYIVPPIRDDVDEKTLDKLLKDNILKPFYLFRRPDSPYTLIYAREEVDARRRINAIWGDYNDIKNQKSFNEYEEFCKKINKTPIKNNEYILDWEFKEGV